MKGASFVIYIVTSNPLSLIFYYTKGVPNTHT